MTDFKNKAGFQSQAHRLKRASLGSAVLGGAFVVGLGISYAIATRQPSKPSPKAPNEVGSVTKSVTNAAEAAASKPAVQPGSNKRLSVYTFGYNQYGQLMLGDETDAFNPRRVNFPEPIAAVRASSKTSALLTARGLVYTAGCGMDGRLGTGITIPPLSAPDQTNPMRVPNLDNIVDLDLGEFGGAALRSDGRLFTWGRSWGGENGHKDQSPGFPELVVHDNRVKQVARGRQHLVFVDDAGAVYSCGVGREGALGLGSLSNVSMPTKVQGALANVRVSKVACGRDSTFALSEDGRLFSWGNDDFGTLGVGKVERRVSEPKQVTSLADTRISQVACGEGFTAAVSADGDLFMCGRGSDGQLATGNRDDSSFFVKVLNLPSPVTKISCGGGHVAALLKDGSLYVWG